MTSQTMSSSVNSDKNQEGGYGWMIVAICFCSHVVIEGMIGSYGLLYPEILVYFSESAAITALPGSLIVGSLLLIGIVASGLIHRFGCRAVAFMGSLIAALGFALSFAAQNIFMFIMSYGVLAGIGIGILYLPSTLMVNTYFHRKRGIAQGIVSSGSGVGMMAVAPLLEYLLSTYGWRGTVLLCSGLFLQLCILSLLMRPHRKSDISITSQNFAKNLAARNCSNNTNFMDTKDIEIYVNSFSDENIPCLKSLKETKPQQTDSKKFFPFQRQADHESTYSLPMDVNRSAADQQNKHFLSMQCVYRPKSPTVRKEICDSEKNMLQRKDIFFSASTTFLEKYESHCSMYDVNEEELNRVIDSRHKSCSLNCGHFLANACKPSVLKNKAFILLSLGCILTQMAQFVPMVFMADYAIQIGLRREDVSVLFVAFGIMNTLGRLFAGGVTSFSKCVSALSVCNVGIAGCAAACLLFPFCKNYDSLAVFMVVFGFFIGFFAPLQPLITLEYVGLENLTSAFGFITMVKGPAAIAGPPLAGSLYQLTNNYSYANVAAGGLFLLNCILQCLIPCVGKPYLDCEDSRDLETRNL